MKQRVLTALVAAPLVLALVFSAHPVPIFLLALAACFFAVDEVAWMAYERRTIVPYVCTTAFGALGVFFRDHYDAHRDVIVTCLGVLFCLSIGFMTRALWFKDKKGILIPSLFWIMAPLMGLLLLHYSVPKLRPDVLFSPNPLLMALIPIWIGDTVAILVGRRFGKRLLAPEISPKKTWEGAFANFVGCLVSAVLIAGSIGLTTRQGLLIGLVAGVLGQMGDLFESAVKRLYDAKDSGWIMPGHGGLLDRIDSLLMPALPITALILYYR